MGKGDKERQGKNDQQSLTRVAARAGPRQVARWLGRGCQTSVGSLPHPATLKSTEPTPVARLVPLAHCSHAVSPLSITKLLPVTYSDSSDARYRIALAISSGSANRPCGCCRVIA